MQQSPATTGSSSDLFRHRNKRRDDAIRKKVEQELSRKTASKRTPTDKDKRRSMRPGTVSSLRPAPAITVLESARIVQAAQLMAAKRADAVLAVNEEGQLSGILTDKDITYRVVAESLDIRTTTVAQVMTRNPISVLDKGSRNEALNIMVARRFRHLPVISAADSDDDGDGNDETSNNGFQPSSPSLGNGASGTNVVGLLDITKCVFERLDDLERKVNEDANIVAAMEALERRGAVASDHLGVIRAHHGCPDLGAVLNKSEDAIEYSPPEVPVRASVRDAAKVMKEFHQTAVLVIGSDGVGGEDRLGGIFTTKDIVLRVIAAGLDPSMTSVVRVMTPHPDSVTTETTILDALKKLHVGHYLHLPVVEAGVPVGLVDVMTLTMAMLDYLMSKDVAKNDEGGAPGGMAGDSGPLWNKFWNSTFTANSIHETESDVHSAASGDDRRSISSSNAYFQQHPQQFVPHTQAHPAALRSHRSSTYNSLPPMPPGGYAPQQQQGNQGPLRRASTILTFDDSSSMMTGGPDPSKTTFKLKDPNTQQIHRFTASSTDLSDLFTQIRMKTGLPCRVASSSSESSREENGAAGMAKIIYEDDEGDMVLLQTDADLEEAVAVARRCGWSRVMLHVQSTTNVPNISLPTVASSGMSDSTAAREPSEVSSLASNRRPTRKEKPEEDQQGPSVFEVLREAPLPVNVAISAGIVVLAAYLVNRLQKM